MLFNSLDFAYFLILAFAGFYVFNFVTKRFFGRTDLKWIPIAAASAYFYLCSGFGYMMLMLLAIVITFFCGIAMEKVGKHRRKWVLCATLVTCLGILFTFKYLGFFTNNANSLLSLLGVDARIPLVQLMLPVGISFYTFQTLSYVIDVYRGTTPAEHHFGKYFAFIAFFPQLVAGPIERSDNLLPQIKTEVRFRYAEVVSGLRLMLWGFFKKMVIADNLATHVNLIYETPQEHTGWPLIIATVFFAFQIYCDFSGYSDIAIGVGRLFGIRLMRNFNSPYLSASLKEFWSRWHISLSTWFKDYVYIPLGGNRISAFRTSLNLFITFLVSGFWHGASWNFVIWGGLHGLFQVIEKHFPKKLTSKIPHFIKVIVLFAFVCITWVFFRAETFSDAIYIITHMFDFSATSDGIFKFLLTLHLEAFNALCYVGFLAMLMVFDGCNKSEKGKKLLFGMPRPVRWCLYAVIAIIIFTFMPIENKSSFIYFQF